MENKKKKEIIKRLERTCQIDPIDKEKQLDILKKQKEEIERLKNLSSNNLTKLKFIYGLNFS